MKIEAITIGEIIAVIAVLTGLIKGVEYLYLKFAKCAEKWLKNGLVPICEQLERIENRIDNVEKELDEEIIDRLRPELMRILSLAARGAELNESESKHLYKVKEKYNEKGGDSYVDDYFDKLRKEGKI